MGLSHSVTYVKREGKDIYVRGSVGHQWMNRLTASEALEIASLLVTEANKVNGTTEPSVTLKLRSCEAEALRAVLHRVGGDPKDSPRGKVQAVVNKLAEAGVRVPKFGFETIGGGLWFKNYDGTGQDAVTRYIAELFSFGDE